MPTVVDGIAGTPSAPAGASTPSVTPVLRGGGWLLLLVFLVSGASGLVYQVVWSRELTLVFGSTTQGVATVLAAFMGGLALGSWAASRLGDGLARPLRAYAWIEAGIALGSLAVLALMPALNTSYRAIYPLVHLSLPGLTLVRFLLASAFLLPATTLMGATLPILSASSEKRGGVAGQGASTLYAVNTLGAVVGAAGAGFFLLPAVGVRGTTLLAAAGNVAAAAGAFFLAARAESAGRGLRLPFTRARRDSDQEIADRWPLEPRALAAVAAALALSGAGALILEVAWTRTLSLVLGSSTHAFTAMLTTFLIGLAAGSAVATRVLGRLRNPLAVFAFVELVVGLTVYLGTFVFPELPYAFLVLFRLTRHQPAVFQIGRFVLAGMVMFAPTFMLGATFPLGVRCWRMAGAGAARPVGTLYALNTIGAILGSLAAGFFLVPVVGLRMTLVTGSIVNLTVGAFLLAVAPSENRRRSLILAGLVVLMLPLIPGGASEWNPAVMTSGVFQYAPLYAPQFPTRASFFAYHDAHRQLFYKDGPTTTVTVEKRPLTKGGHVWLVLTVNGKVDASSIGDMETQVLLGQFPLLAARDPQRALVIGWGSGATAGSMLTLPTLKTLRAVEIEPAVIEASHFFRDFNHDPYGDPRLSLEINDARHALLVDDTKYDVIVSEPSNPWLSGPSRLFTREFFEIVRSRLAEGGILCQWVQLYGLDPNAYRALLRTLGSVFEDVVVVKGSPGDTLVMASATPIRFDVARMAARMAIPSVAADLARIRIEDPETLLTRFRVGGRATTALAGDGPLNTDDNALIEFAALKNLYDETHLQNDELLLKAPSSPLDRVDVAGLPPDAATRFPIAFASALSRAGLDERAQSALVRADSAQITPSAIAEGAAIRGDLLLRAGKRPEARAAWKEALRRDPGCMSAADSLGLDLGDADADAGESASLLAAAVAAKPDSAGARVALARALRASRRHADAIRELRAAADLGPSPAIAPFLHMLWGRSCMALGDSECAAREIGRYFDEWPELTKPARLSVDAALDLGRAELTLGRKQPALEHLKLAIDTAAAVASWERDQADAAARRADGDAAEAHLRAAITWSPADAGGYRRLGDFLMDRRRWEDALGIWSQLLRSHPDDILGLTGSVEALKRVDRLGAAAPLLRRLIDLEEDPERIRFLEATLDRATGSTGPARPNP